MASPTAASNRQQLSHPTYRPDIDGLRALAVLSVVIFHAFPQLLPGGFIGVDIFFVISGFLISSIIFSNLEGGSFSLLEFYNRRIKRIFPALLLVLFASLGVGWVLMFAHEFTFLGKHVVGGAGFVSNIVLWKESGYFDSVAEKKPLMHLWSLAVEEQFYFFWPIFMMLVYKRKWNFVAMTTLVAVVSFATNIYLTGKDPTVGFYSPVTRFWELMLGGGLAYLSLHRPASLHTHPHARSALGLGLMALGLLLIDRDRAFPGWWALLPTLGAVLLISAGPQAWVNKHLLSHRLAVWFGLISYPIYLWHWPALSFARIVEGEELSAMPRLAMVAFTIVAAWLTYQFVEKRMRHGPGGRLKTLALISLMGIAGGVGYAAVVNDGFQNRSLPRQQAGVTQALGHGPAPVPVCDKDFVSKPCKAAPNEPFKIMILGDSHGAHLYQGLATATPASIIGVGTCLPLTDVFMHVDKNKAAHSCAKTNYVTRNIKILQDTPSVETVIISAFWRPVLDPQFNTPREQELWGKVTLHSTRADEGKLDQQALAERGLGRTIQTLLSLHKRVIFLKSNPDIETDFTDTCLPRKRILSGHPLPDCVIPRSQAVKQRAHEDRMIDSLVRTFPQITVVDPFDTLCDADQCYLLKDGAPLYVDSHHLSTQGSQMIGQAILKACGEDCTRP